MKGKSQESNFIRHRIRVRLDGFKPERLISQAMARGIGIRNITYKDETQVVFSVSSSGLKQMKKLAGSRYRFTVLKEGGAVPAVRKLRRRKMTIAGFALFLLLFFSQTLFVREINVIGCKGITETSIRQSIAEEGLYEGAFRNFDCSAIEKKLFQTFDNIVWARVAYEGGYVEVQISESEQAPMGDITDSAPCDIVARQDCYIERIYTYKGRAMVSESDFVKKGGILISGTVPIEHPSYPVKEGSKPVHYTHASGKIVARVPYYFNFYIERNPDKEARNKEAERLLRQWIKENIPKTAEILNKDFHFSAKKNIIRVYGTVETRQQVGIEKEIVIDKHKRGTKEGADRR